jgi:hypothetical protein
MYSSATISISFQATGSESNSCFPMLGWLLQEQKEEEMKELKEILQDDKKVIWLRPK